MADLFSTPAVKLTHRTISQSEISEWPE